MVSNARSPDALADPRRSADAPRSPLRRPRARRRPCRVELPAPASDAGPRIVCADDPVDTREPHCSRRSDGGRDSGHSTRWIWTGANSFRNGGRVPGGREGLRALTYPHEQRIEVFVRRDDTTESLHRVLAHEFGHVIDVELNSSGRSRSMGSSTTTRRVGRWWPGESAPDFATGAGDFAEAFAVLETGVRSQSSVAGQPTCRRPRRIGRTDR